MRPVSPALVMYSANMRRTVSFYGALGLSFKKERHGSGPEHYACDLGGFVIEIYPVAQQPPATGAISGYRMVIPTPDLAKSVQAAERLGRTIDAPKPTALGCSAIVSDPDGRHVLLIETGPTPHRRGKNRTRRG